MLDFGFYNLDCMEGMRQFPDKYFQLAICDPPYNIQSENVKANSSNNATSRLKKYGDLSKANDKRPSKEVFDEIFRVSENQIIWGYNHLSDILPTTTEFIFWYKHNPVVSYSDGELAWTSFKRTAVCFDYPYYGCHGADVIRIHPVQKPIALYKWLLSRYCCDGGSVIDPFVGSASSLIACREMGYKYVGFEIDPMYYEQAKKRLDAAESQMNIFDFIGIKNG